MEIVLWFFGIIIAFIAVLELIKKLADRKATQSEAEVIGEGKSENKAKFGFVEIFGAIIIIATIYFLFFTNFNGFEINNQKKYQEYNATSISELRKPTAYITIKDIATDYAIDHSGIGSNRMYDCLSYYVWGRNEYRTVGEMIDWCVEDFKSGKNTNYGNFAETIRDFSEYDGRYIPLERKIKENLNDPSSYEHIKTNYTITLDDKSPYMTIVTSFRNTNIYGAKIINTVRAKVDATTKEIYDIEVE